MAARKSKPVKKATLAKKKKGPQLEDYFKIGESYTSLVMGIVVVIIASILLVSFFRTRTQPHLQKATSSISTVAQQENPSPTPSPTLVPLSVTPPPTQAPINSKEKTYTVKAGDSLWSIAVAEYNDGYKWTEIAKANNLSNPGIINVDNHLVIPAVASSSQPAPASTKMGSASPSTGAAIKGDIYTVVHGDSLWDIAVRAYNDGYKWTEIARVNNLSNPDVINAGNILHIPR